MCILLKYTFNVSLEALDLLIALFYLRVLPSSKHPALVVESMTTLAPVTQLAPTLNDTSPKSCLPSGLSLCLLAWQPWT